MPDGCYDLAARSFVSSSCDDEFATLQTDINDTPSFWVVLKNLAQSCWFYFAASGEMFGKVGEVPQTERTRFPSRSTYGISNGAGFELNRNSREAYGAHTTRGFFFNHESPRRRFEFVTRTITLGVARILAGKSKELRLGILDAQRD